MSTTAISSSTPVAQTTSWLPDCSQLDALAEKYSSNWQTNVLVVGVVGAVASAVGAFFFNMAAFGVAFVALASILAYGAYCAHNSNQNRAALEQTVTELREQKQKLETDKSTLTATATRLQSQFAQVQSTNNHLNHTVSTLQTNVGNLESRNNTLTHTSGALQGEVATLRHDQNNLQHRVTQLQSAIPLLKSQIAEFVDQNIKLGKDLSIADIEIIKTDPLVDELKGSDPQVLELAEQIQRSKAVSTKLFTTFNSQLQALISSHGNLENLEKKLQAQTLTLTSVEQQITTKTDELKNINENSAQAQRSLENKTREIASEQEKLNSVLNNFIIASSDLESVKKELLTSTQKQEELNLLNETLKKTQISFDETKRSLEQETQKMDQLVLDLERIQAEVDAAKAELLAYPGKLEELNKLNGEIATAKSSFEDTQKAIRIEAATLDQLKLEAHDSQVELTAAKTEQLTYTQKLEEFNKLKDEIAAAKSYFEVSQAALDQLKLEAFAAQSELTDAKNELEKYAEKQEELKNLHEEINQAQSTLNGVKSTSDTESLMLQAIQEQIAVKQAELDGILDNIRNGTDLLQKKNSNLELRQAENFQKALKELTDLNSEIDRKKEELEKLKLDKLKEDVPAVIS